MVESPDLEVQLVELRKVVAALEARLEKVEKFIGTDFLGPR